MNSAALLDELLKKSRTVGIGFRRQQVLPVAAVEAAFSQLVKVAETEQANLQTKLRREATAELAAVKRQVEVLMLQAQAADKQLDEYAACLSLVPTSEIVRCCEGGGPESPAGTLALTIGRLVALVEKYRQAAAAAPPAPATPEPSEKLDWSWVKDAKLGIQVDEEELATIDPQIAPVVRILLQGGVETFESCQGGPGHAFPEPTVRFHGQLEAGFRALAIAICHNLPVCSLRQYWDVTDKVPVGPNWEMTFSPPSRT